MPEALADGARHDCERRSVGRECPLDVSHVGRVGSSDKRARPTSIASNERTGVAVQLVSEDASKITVRSRSRAISGDLLICMRGDDDGCLAWQVSCMGANGLVGEREVMAATALLKGPFRVGFLLLTLEVDMWSMRRVAAAARKQGVFVALKTSPLDASNRHAVIECLREQNVKMLFVSDLEATQARDCVRLHAPTCMHVHTHPTSDLGCISVGSYYPAPHP